MADKDSGDKKLGVGSKTLSLKPRIETGVVRQSFSHGRSKQVVVEKKTKRRLAGDPAPVVEAAPAQGGSGAVVVLLKSKNPSPHEQQLGEQ